MSAFNLSDMVHKTTSDAEETTNNSFGPKESKEMLSFYNTALGNSSYNLYK